MASYNSQRYVGRLLLITTRQMVSCVTYFCQSRIIIRGVMAQNAQLYQTSIAKKNRLKNWKLILCLILAVDLHQRRMERWRRKPVSWMEMENNAVPFRVWPRSRTWSLLPNSNVLISKLCTIFFLLFLLFNFIKLRVPRWSEKTKIENHYTFFFFFF